VPQINVPNQVRLISDMDALHLDERKRNPFSVLRPREDLKIGESADRDTRYHGSNKTEKHGLNPFHFDCRVCSWFGSEEEGCKDSAWTGCKNSSSNLRRINPCS
jgi:hypothetical protein